MAAQALWERRQSIAILAVIATDENARSSDRIAAVHLLNVMHGYNMPQKIAHSSADGSMTTEPTIDVTKLSDSALAEILAAKVLKEA